MLVSRKPPVFAACLLALPVLLFALRTSGIAIDDFYITYRYAQNPAAGRGFVFNPGQRVFGVTNPGLGLLLAGLRAATGWPVPHLATAVYTVGLLAVGGCVVRSAARRGFRIAPVLAGILIGASAFVWKAQGSEVSLALALLLGAAVASESSRPAISGLLAGLLAGAAVWMRPDAGLGVALLALLLWREERRLPVRFAVAAGLVVAIGIAAAWLYFGTPMPITFASKRHLAAVLGQGGFGEEGFWIDGWRVWKRHAGPLGGLAAGLGAAGCVPAFRAWGRASRLAVLFGWGIVLIYPALGVPFSIWYAFPFAAALLLGLAAATGYLAEKTCEAFRRRRMPQAAASLALLAISTVAILGLCIASARWLRDFAESPRQRAYREAALWVRDHSRPGRSIAFGEIGAVGFYSERPVVDLLGLITPGSLPFAAEGDLVGAFLARPTTFLLWHTERRGTRAIVEKPWFARAYREVARIPQIDRKAEVVVFRRRPGIAIPPPRAPRPLPLVELRKVRPAAPDDEE